MNEHSKILIESIFNCFDYSTHNFSLKISYNLQESIREKEEKRKQIYLLHKHFWNISEYIIERALEKCILMFFIFLKIHFANSQLAVVTEKKKAFRSGALGSKGVCLIFIAFLLCRDANKFLNLRWMFKCLNY